MGEIINIICDKCNNEKRLFIGEGRSFEEHNIYHCPNCYYIKTEIHDFEVIGFDEILPTGEYVPVDDNLNKEEELTTEKGNKIIYCSVCKSSNIFSEMNEIKKKHINKLNCSECKEKKLKVLIIGHWD